MEPSDVLRAFRQTLYECFNRRADALFELTDAVLTADAVPSPAHLSLQPLHRRGWGSLYAALDRGRIDAEALRRAYSPTIRLRPRKRDARLCAVEVSVWPRCDAESSPQRGFYYHPSRHSAGQPIVAGWAYQFIAKLDFVRESWRPLRWTRCAFGRRRTPKRGRHRAGQGSFGPAWKRRGRPPVCLRRGLRPRQGAAGS
jgi:hypothetical protein